MDTCANPKYMSALGYVMKKRRVSEVHLQFNIEIFKKGKCYLAKAPELDFISQGKTVDEAKKNLLELISIQFKEMKEMGILNEYFHECGFETKKNKIISHSELIGFEKSMLLVS